jgi:hypothetical protein
MNEQLLKDFIATAQKYNYDWNKTFGLFPELKSYDQQVLKDYVATAEKYSYDYSKVNSLFPEFGFAAPQEQLKKKEQPQPQPTQQAQQAQGMAQAAQEKPATELSSGVSSSALPSAETPEERGLTLLTPEFGKKVAEQEKTGAFMGSQMKQPTMKVEPLPPFAPSKSEQDFNASLEEVNKELMDYDEDYIVTNLNYLFGKDKYGFEFNYFRDAREAVEVKAPNGKTIVIPVDAFTEKGDIESAEQFKKFLDENKPKLAKLSDEYNIYQSTIKNEQDMKKATESINAETMNLNKVQQELVLENNSLEKELKYLQSVPQSERGSQDYINRVDEYNKRKTDFSANLNNASLMEKDISAKQSQLYTSIGRYTSMRAEQGGFFGGLYNSLLGGYSSMGAAETGIATDVIMSLPLELTTSPKDIQETFTMVALSKGVEVPANMNYEKFQQWSQTLDEETKSEINSEVKDYLTKRTKGEMIPSIRKGLVEIYGAKGTTPEYIEDAGLIKGGIYGLAGSLPAMSFAGAGPAGTMSAFFLQGYDATMKEMESEEFKGVSENEKYLVALPVGIVSAALEEFGMRNVLGKSGLVNDIVAKALSKSGSKTSATTFKQLVENEIESRVARGALVLTAAGLAEAETGAAQAAAEIGIKEIYNTVKGKDMFKTPETVGEFIKEVAVAGAQEAIGGVVMGSFNSVGTAYGENNFNGVTNETLEIFSKLANDDNARNAYAVDLKMRVVRGEITAEQGNKALDNLNNSISVYNSIPDNLAPAQQRQAFSLLRERKGLEAEIDGKDEALTKKQRERIKEINEELSNLPETAPAEAAPAEAAPVEDAKQKMEKELRESLPYEYYESILDSELSFERESAKKFLEDPKAYFEKNIEIAKQNLERNPDNKIAQSVLDDNTEKLRIFNEITNKYKDAIQKQGKPAEAAPAETKADIGKIYAKELRGQIRKRLRNEGKSEDEINKLTGTAESPIITSLTSEDISSLIDSYKDSKAKQLENYNKYKDRSTPEEEVVPEIGEFISNDTSFWDNKIAELTKIKEEQDAIQKPSTEEGVLRAEQPQVGLQEVGQGDQGQEVAQAPLQDQEIELTQQINELEASLADETQQEITFGETTLPRAEAEAKLEQLTTEREAVQFEASLQEEVSSRTPQAGVSVSNKSQLKTLATKTTDKVKSGVIAAASRAVNTLKSVFPDMDIVIHETTESYVSAGGNTTSRGNFQATRDASGKIVKGVVNINLESADMTTVAHEVAHAVMLKAFGQNPALFKRFRDRINTVLADSTIAQLDEFASQYNEADSHEEYLVQLSAVLSANEQQLPTSVVQRIAELINKVVSMATNGAVVPFKGTVETKQLIEFLNTMSSSIAKGQEIEIKGGVELNTGGEVGVFNIVSKAQMAAPKATEDSRSFIRDLVQDVDIREFNGMPFVTNMYDYTNAGVTDLGNGFTINMMGGKSYVPYIMSLQNKKIGDVSNLSAFNSKENAEAFIRNAIGGKANLFAPHSGTMSESWQFQQHTFSELVNLILDKNILSNDELISVFNKTIVSNAENIRAFNIFNQKYKEEEISNFDSFKSNPKKIVELLDIQNNFSPDLRKALNNAIAADKTFQKAIGIKNKEQFFERIMDPLNKGVVGGEIISVVKFDPKTLKVVKTDPKNPIDHHPSFGWAVLAKIEGIYQPSEFHKSSSVTKSYTKYNLGGKQVSRKASEPDFEKKNVASSAGAIPKVAKFVAPKPTKTGVTTTTKEQRAGDVAKALEGIDVTNASRYLNIEQTLPISLIDEMPRGKTFQEKLAPEYYNRLKNDIKENGVKEPIILKYYVKDNAIRLFEGHHRLKIARELGIQNVPIKVNVVWGSSIKEGNEDIVGQKIYNPPTEINIEKYSKRNYAPSNISLEELGFKNNEIAEAYIKAKQDGSNPKLVKAVEDVIGTTTTTKEQKGNEAEAIVKQGRANGVSENAIRSVLSRRGFTAEQIDAAMAKPEAAGKTKVDETFAEGFDRLMKEIEGIIKKSTYRKRSQEDILDNVVNYIIGSKLYENATDVQREQMIRDARKRFGKREKSAPKVETLLGGINSVDKITIAVRELVANQIKSLARGAKDAKKAWMKASAILSDDIKEMVASGKISSKQAAAVIKRFAKVDMFNETSVENFVNYMAKVFADAEYDEKIAGIKSKLKTAKKNIYTKLGISKNLVPLLDSMLAINPTLVPESVFDTYIELVDMLSKREAVLSLQEVNAVTEKTEKILDAINKQESVAAQAYQQYLGYDEKVIKDDEVDFAATVKKMVENNLLTEADAEILRKYKNRLMEREGKKKTEEEIAQERTQMLDSLDNTSVTPDALPSRMERDAAAELIELAKSDAVKGLDNIELNNLLKALDNIANGYFPHQAQLLIERLNAINRSKPLANAEIKAKPLAITKVYASLKSLITRNKTAIEEMIRRSPLKFIDQVFGDFKTQDIFKSLFEPISSAYGQFASNLKRVENRLDDAYNNILKSHGGNPLKTLMSSYKITAYMIQNEFDSNKGSKQVNKASDFLKATIKQIYAGESHLSEKNAEMLQEVLDWVNTFTDADGNVDTEAMLQSMSKAERDAIGVVREINDSLTEKAMFTASVIRGEKIKPLNNYVHLQVMKNNYNPEDNTVNESDSMMFSDARKPSSKAKNLIERTGDVSPINFDIFSSAQRGARFVLLDYHMTPAIRTARKTLAETKKSLENEDGIIQDKKTRQVNTAINNVFEEVLRNTLSNTFTVNSFAEEVVDYISKTGYRAVLAGVPRFASELTSNVGFAAIIDPEAFSQGFKLRGVSMSAVGADVMLNLGSGQVTRIYSNDPLTGRLIDTQIMSQSGGKRMGKANRDVANKLQQIYNNTLGKYKNSVEFIADALISTPDKIVMRSMWFGSFAKEFKKITGVEPDFDKIAANDEAYMNEYKDALKESTSLADDKTVLTAATDNPFMGILKGAPNPNQGAFVKAFNIFNNYMTRFLIYEYMTARQGIMAAMGNGYLTRKQGAAMLGAVMTRMTVYTFLMSILTQAMVGLFVDDEDEDDEKSLLQKFGQSLTSAVTGLLLGRDFGNATKSLINYGIELGNEKFLDFLREGEYDPYNYAIAFSPITVEPTKKDGEKSAASKRKGLYDYLINMTGPYASAFKSADLIVRKAFEEPKKTPEAIERQRNEKQIRIPLEVLGNLGLIPLYKDVRKVTMKAIYKDLDKASTKSDAEKAQEELDKPPYGLTMEEYKRYFPKEYEKRYGEKSEYRKRKKDKNKLKDAKDEVRRKMLDDFYNYQPKKKKGPFEGNPFEQKKEEKEKKKGPFEGKSF